MRRSRTRAFTRDRWFESAFLQRRVGCELPSNQGIFENYRMEFEKLQRQKQTPGIWVCLTTAEGALHRLRQERSIQSAVRCSSVRAATGSAWHRAPLRGVPGQPYRCRLPDGRELAIPRAGAVRLTYPRAALCLIATYRLAQKRESRVGSNGDPSSDASSKPEWGGTHGAGLRYRRSAIS